MATRSKGSGTMALFDLDGTSLNQGYLNLRAAQHPNEQIIKDELEAMWVRFEPYAETNFAVEFAHDPDARFWEMYLGCILLDEGKTIERPAHRCIGQGNPDFCVIDGERRIWIEAIAPTRGTIGEDQVPELAMAENGERSEEHGWQPLRQVHLRITSALREKARKLQEQYVANGVIGEQDIYLVAINGGRFALQAGGWDFPTALSAVYPIGDEFVSINRDTHRIVGHGHHRSGLIERAAGAIDRTAFFDEQYAQVSGLIWSRASIGTASRTARPLSLIHNYVARNPLAHGWLRWDSEYQAVQGDGRWMFPNLRAQRYAYGMLEPRIPSR
jgi:hypothetical protein